MKFMFGAALVIISFTLGRCTGHQSRQPVLPSLLPVGDRAAAVSSNLQQSPTSQPKITWAPRPTKGIR